MRKRNVLNKATIRNAKVCSGFNNIGYESKFNVERDNKGWDATEGVGVYGVSGGFAFLISSTNAPTLFRSTRLSSIDSSIYTEIVIRYRYKKNNDTSVATQGKIQFATQQPHYFSDAKSVTFTVIPDGEWQTYYINMAAVTEWVGYITNLKIIFATNGSPNDEVCVSYIKIQSDTFNFCIDNCFEEQTDTLIAYNFDDQQTGALPAGFATVNTGSDRTVAIAADTEILSNKTVLLNKTSGINIGPSIINNFSREISSGYFSCRFRVTNLFGNIKIQTDTLNNTDAIDIKISSLGKLQVKQESSYVDFSVEHSISINRWYNLLMVFNINTGFFSVDLDGVQLDNSLILTSIRLLTGIRIDNSATSSCGLYIDDFIVVESTEENISCPGIGKQGEITGTEVVFDQLSIIEDLNDTLIVNINNYGDEVIKLQPETNLTLSDIRSKLEYVISSVDIGGYLNVEVIIVDNKLNIKSGTFGFDSTVEVKQHLDSTLSESLGFTFNSLPVGETKLGRPASIDFQFSNTYRSPTRKLHDLLVDKEDESHPVIHDPQKTSVEIGYYRAGEVGRKNKISGANTTIVDFYNRASEEGYIREVYFHGLLSGYASIKFSGNLGSVHGNIFNAGVDLNKYNIVTGDLLVIDTPGYIDNGTYVITTFTWGNQGNQCFRLDGVHALATANLLNFYIHNIPKIKHFRPSKRGTLTLINEVEIGNQNSGLYSRTLDSHKVSVNWYIHRGDLIGIYNAKEVYIGNDPNADPNALYLKYDYDVINETQIENVEGFGTLGVGLYGTNLVKQDRAIYDISLGDSVFLDYIDVYATQVEEVASYNLCSAIHTGLSVVSTITGTHDHLVFNENDVLDHWIIHNNVGYNIATLTDGITFASNGYLETFQQNSPSASYFYISGDGEFSDYILDEEGNLVEDSQEGFTLASPWIHKSIENYNSDAYDLTFNFSSLVTIDKFKIYFKEFPNAEGFWLEYLKQPGAELYGSKLGYELIGRGKDKYFTRVRVNNFSLTEATLSGNALDMHFNTKFIGFVDSYNMDNGAVYQDLQNFPFTILEKEINSVRTSSFNWHCNYHKSTKISEIELFTNVSTKSAINSLFELYFSTDGSYFQRASGEKVSEEQVRYKIAYPVKYLRLVTEPSGLIKLDKIVGTTQEDSIRYIDREKETTATIVDLIADRGTFSDPKEIKIKNLTGTVADVEISIDTVETSTNILLKSSLNSNEVINSPDIGPGGVLIQDSSFDLPTVKNVAINVDAFGLKNLIDTKAFYITEDFDSESDNFASRIDLTKWEHLYSQFPSGISGHYLSLDFPGFSIIPEPGPTGSPANNSTVIAKLRSTWEILGSFSASIVCSYDARGGRPTHMGSAIGIQDASGREIIIKKDRVLYVNNLGGGGTITYKYIEYLITDSLLGTIGTKRVYDDYPAYGVEDDTIEYSLGITRVKAEQTDVLQLYYTDTSNGTGTQQFGEEKYIEINLSSLTTPLTGKIKTIIYNYWYTNTLSSTGTPGSLGTHVKINRFLFGGESSYIKKYNFISGKNFTGTDGYIGISNQGNLNKTKLLALDLGQRYFIDLVENYSKTGKNLWSRFNVQYSNSEEDNPNYVTWGNSYLQNARWLLFSEGATVSGSLKYLDYLKVYPDIINKPIGLLENSSWIFLGNVLSDNKLTTNINSANYYLVVIKLENQFRMSNFKIFDIYGNEYGRPTSNSLYGWSGDCVFSLSSYLGDDPTYVTWDNWLNYEEANKEPKVIKWLAFKNIIPYQYPTPYQNQYMAEIQVSTEGKDYTDVGQTNDRVDFTEYSKWFEVEYQFDTNINPLSGSLNLLEDYLFGSSDSIDSTIIDIFNGVGYYPIKLMRLPAYLWRCFGDPYMVDESGPSIPYSGINGNISIPGEKTSSITINYYTVQISAIEIEVNSAIDGIPNTIEIQTFTGTNPLSDLSWLTIYTETNLATTNSDGEYEFYNNNPYSVRFESPVVTSGLRLKITEAVFFDNYNTVNISKFRILTGTDNQNSNLVLLSNDGDNRVGGSRSLKITCLSGVTDSVNITTGGNFNLEPDPLWSIQDYLSFYFKINNIEELDLDKSYIRIGKDKNACYKWSLFQFGSLNTGNFDNIKLKFLDALDHGEGKVDYDNYDPYMVDSQVDFIKGPIGFFQLEIKPKNTLLNNVEIWLDNFNIVRENFEARGINKTLYLNNRELLYFPLVGFDLRKGFFEATITPDWDYQSKRVLVAYEANAIFAAYNEEQESLMCYYDINKGLTFVITSKTTKIVAPLGLIRSFEKYKPFKLTVVWDADGLNLGGSANSTLRIWLNDQFMGDVMMGWNILTTKYSYFYIGSMVSTDDVSIRGIEAYMTSEYYKIVPDIKSLDGAIENLIIASSPIKLEYSLMQRLKDQLYISLDGITYYPGSSNNLPFKLYSIENLEEISIWIKNYLPVNTNNLTRTGFIKTKWRLAE